MRRFWYRRMIVMILVFAFSVGGSWYVIRTNQKALEKEVGADTSNELLIPGGMPVGIYLETEGALVLGTEGVTGEDGEEHEPAAHLVKEGDYIIALDDEEIKNKSQLIEAVAALESDDIVLTVLRNNQKIDIRMKAVRCERNEYRLGIWVRDNAQGLGTVTVFKFRQSVRRSGTRYSRHRYRAASECSRRSFVYHKHQRYTERRKWNTGRHGRNYRVQ